MELLITRLQETLEQQLGMCFSLISCWICFGKANITWDPNTKHRFKIDHQTGKKILKPFFSLFNNYLTFHLYIHKLSSSYFARVFIPTIFFCFFCVCVCVVIPILYLLIQFIVKFNR